MTAKEYLNQVKSVYSRTRVLVIERNSLLSISAYDYSKDKVQTSQNRGNIDDIVLKRETIDNEIFRLIYLNKEVIDTIQSLNDWRYITILHDHYIEGKLLRDIAKDMGLGYYYVKALHLKALKALDELLQADNKMIIIHKKEAEY